MKTLGSVVDAYARLGYIQRAQGLRGHVVAQLDYEIQASALEVVFVQMDETLVPYRVEHCTCQPSRAVLKLQGVDAAAEAYALRGKAIFVPKEALPQPDGGAAHWAGFISYQVVDGVHGPLGTVQDVYERPLQPLLAVDYRGRELLVPCHDDIVVGADAAEKVLHVRLPAGLLEL